MTDPNAQARKLLETVPPPQWSVRKVILNFPQLANALEHDAVCLIAQQAPATLTMAITLAEFAADAADEDVVPIREMTEEALACRLEYLQGRAAQALTAWEGLFPEKAL